MKQPRDGQAYTLRRSDNTDPRTTHVAVNRLHGFKYFCRWEERKSIHATGNGPDFISPVTFWVTPCPRYGSCYNGCSLWQAGFDFIPLEEWEEE